MKSPLGVALAMLAGVALGATAVTGLNAQNQSPGVYVIGETQVIDKEAAADYGPRLEPTFKPFGGHYIARTGKTVSFAGEPPKNISMIAFGSLGQAQAWQDSAAYKEIKPLRDKAVKIRLFAVEAN
jgi:uncharacterized protein (DUF1330 family)